MLKAMAEPMLMQCSTHAMRAVVMTALTGTTKCLWGTREIQALKGTPESRANAKSWRDAPAMFVRLFTMPRMTRTAERPVAPATEPVACSKVAMIG